MAGRVPEERLARLEAALASVEQAVHTLETRLDRLEQQARATPTEEPEPLWMSLVPFGSADLGASGGAARDSAVKVTALTGTALLALAGAYLLRALTESGAMRPSGGIGVGIAYAFVWFALASRPLRDRVASTFHGGIGCIVAFPLVWEAATKFHLLNAASGALLLGAIVFVALAVSAHRSLQPLAWIATLSAVALTIALVVATDRVFSFACVMIALGIGTLWLGYVRDWLYLRWPVALVADVMVIGATVRVLSGNTHESAALAAALALLLPASYLVNIIVRTVVRGRDVIPFEIAQTIAALGVGLACVAALARYGTFGINLVGWGGVALGTSCYTVAFLFIARGRRWRANLYFYTSIGLLLVLASTALLLADPTIAFAGLAIATALAAAQLPAALLILHTAIYTGAAAVTAGVVPFATARFIGSAAEWPPITASMVVVMVAAGISLVLAACRRGTTAIRVERCAMLVLFIYGASGWLVDVLAVATARGRAPLDPAVVATIRTAVIAAVAVLAAAVGRIDAIREVGWLVYPLLVAAGIKLIVEDVVRSRPATLFIAFAVYGAALIAAPRLRATATAPPEGADRERIEDPVHESGWWQFFGRRLRH